MRIYVASSWRNEHQPAVVELLRGEGHSVYDFRNPPEETAFSWAEIDPEFAAWRPEELDAGLVHPIAVAAYDADMRALNAADAVVLVLPCGASAHLEAGWAAALGKAVVVYIPPGEVCQPELMYLMAVNVVGDFLDLLTVLAFEDDAEEASCS